MMTNEASGFQARQVNIGMSDIRPAVRSELNTLKSQVKAAIPRYTDRASKVHLENLMERIEMVLDPD